MIAQQKEEIMTANLTLAETNDKLDATQNENKVLLEKVNATK